MKKFKGLSRTAIVESRNFFTYILRITSLVLQLYCFHNASEETQIVKIEECVMHISVTWEMTPQMRVVLVMHICGIRM